jgi:predicted CoA-substrate-specific enzyme activase
LEKRNTSLGICVGASTVSFVTLVNGYNEIIVKDHNSIKHHGNPKQIITDVLNKEVPAKIVVTGRKFKNFLNLTSISEAEAIEYSIDHLGISTDLVISAGGENFIIYQLDKYGKILKALTGNKCASGTGEFFLQQIKRMNLSLEESIELAQKGDPHNISGRCSVFCKSDCTHALNKGTSKQNVVAGLSKMMAQKIFSLISQLDFESAILIGGVSLNKSVIKFLKNNIDVLTIPKESTYFEALGAAVYALKNNTISLSSSNYFKDEHSSFSFHEKLNNCISKVRFETINRGTLKKDDVCIIGLDVGSTTTKAVLLRVDDNTIIASEYLRTNGDPIKASKECYCSIKNQLSEKIKIIGLGVTGSGRHIVGLHALTKGIINEIIAHSTASLYFDKDVDTIIEIGGQDAKYTYLTSGVASDYAMNEACSAGTGSFLEEAAKESLDIDYKEIGELALKSSDPPNFNDQCSAFISSDIKNALQEGLKKEDVLAGLVYSICLNYVNRVKGNRPIGNKIFMQGGVCYNKAVPIAMAALTGKNIIVPPDPGLMGAFGVALEIKKRIELKLFDEQEFNLDTLIKREVSYEKTFICAGGSEKCDRKCNVSLINLNGRKYPFGGACDKYYNVQQENCFSEKNKNLVKLRQELVFDKYLHRVKLPDDAVTIGISKSFLTNTLYPLYYNFFTQLGFRIILGDNPRQEGIEKKESSFCYPAELAHGFMHDLIHKKVDYIFLPHILDIYNEGNTFYDRTCVLLQSEVYYLKSTFRKELEKIKILSPVISFSPGYESTRKDFLQIAYELKKNKVEASSSFDFALSKFRDMLGEFKSIGKRTISELENNPKEFAMVLFGRTYNSFAGEAHLGIPQKFASKNLIIIPHDFLSSENYDSLEHMYWGMGNQILRSARFVKDHPQLFGVFITNFSCGPDSMLLTYFRDIMERKPSLTLELDSHSADAGINTRIEAAIDIIKSYRELNIEEGQGNSKNNFVQLKVKDSHTIVDSDGNDISIFDDRIKLMIPSMGRYGAEAFAAAFRFMGINSEAVPIPTMETLKEGRGCTTCKECLPLILNAGSLLQHHAKFRKKGEITLYFMAEGTGPCRFGQYHIYLENIIKKNLLKNVGIYTLTDEDSYGGLGNEFVKRGWAAITIADVFQNIHHAILAIAENKNEGLNVLEKEWEEIIKHIQSSSFNKLYEQLEKTALRLNKLNKIKSIQEAVKVVLTGEIYVRQDEFSRMDLIDKLAAKNIVVKVVPIGEYVYYSNYLAIRDKGKQDSTLYNKLKFSIRNRIQNDIEKQIKAALSKSSFYEYELINIEEIIMEAEHLVDPKLLGEAILTIGTSLKEILIGASGIISFGPFGCMQSRVAEAILNTEMNYNKKTQTNNIINNSIENLPFLAIETDGNLFPQIIQSKIEIFILQTERIHKQLRENNYYKQPNSRKSLLYFLFEKYFSSNQLRSKKGNEFSEIIPETD